MPTDAERYAVDTSVAVAALDAAHAAHEMCRAVVVENRPSLAGHAAFETLSVLTRLPGPLAIDAPSAADLIARVFPTVARLDADPSELIARLGMVGITGGAVYDALVGEAARTNDVRLLTRDQRARRTYDLLGVDYELVGL
ncbi:PIN domain-containing protein [Ilumatobacter fluminis]|uniref:Ribonuclease VapC n=1 Tax=Ilumatobacter fluminis TaxID=467091 RepID=A0A4R7I1I5_9ACTN|nr:PIN domain-containing protein [Ilumatobacter fluminis]TDT17295.1 PIN domain-containing protein [Ilumatobacter fluminis]